MSIPEYPQPAPAEKKPWHKRTWILISGVIVLAVLLICCLGTVIIAASQAPESTSSSTPPAPPKASISSDGDKIYRIGETVRGGDFEFVVHSSKCDIAQVGGDFVVHKAQGMYCRVDVTAKNVTKSAHYFHADNAVKAKDVAGRTYSADGEAGIYGNKDGAGFLDEVNPGNQVRAFVYFDVPKGTKLTQIVFDAGLFTLAQDALVTL